MFWLECSQFSNCLFGVCTMKVSFISTFGDSLVLLVLSLNFGQGKLTVFCLKDDVYFCNYGLWLHDDF